MTSICERPVGGASTMVTPNTATNMTTVLNNYVSPATMSLSWTNPTENFAGVDLFSESTALTQAQCYTKTPLYANQTDTTVSFDFPTASEGNYISGFTYNKKGERKKYSAVNTTMRSYVPSYSISSSASTFYYEPSSTNITHDYDNCIVLADPDNEEIVHLFGGPVNSDTVNGYQNHYRYNVYDQTYVRSFTLPASVHGASIFYGAVGTLSAGYHILTYQSDVMYHYYSTNGGSWSTITVPTDMKITDGYLIFYKDKLHYLGENINTETSTTSTIHYIFDGTEWSTGVACPVKCTNGAAIVYGDKLHVLGGAGNNKANYYLSDSTATAEWAQDVDLPIEFTAGDAVIYLNAVHIYSGLHHSKLDLTTLEWSSYGDGAVSMENSRLITVGNTLQIFAGTSNLKRHGRFSLQYSMNFTLPAGYYFKANLITPRGNDSTFEKETNHKKVYMTTLETNISTYLVDKEFTFAPYELSD